MIKIKVTCMRFLLLIIKLRHLNNYILALIKFAVKLSILGQGVEFSYKNSDCTIAYGYLYHS